MDSLGRIEIPSLNRDYEHIEIDDTEDTGRRRSEGIQIIPSGTLGVEDVVERGNKDEKENYGHGVSLGYRIKPETYNGEGDWEEYITHFELCAEIGKWTKKNTPLILGASLQDQARKYYTGLSRTERRDYHVLVQKLGHRFGRIGKSQISRWRQEFENRRRYIGESLATLADDLHSLSRRAYRDFDTKTQQTLALDQLYKSLKPEVKLRCVDKDCTTLGEAVEVIDMYEHIMEEDNTPRKDDTQTSLQNHSCATFRMDKLELAVERLTENLHIVMKHLTMKDDTKSKRRRNTCYICNSPRHFKGDCPHYRNKRL